DAALLHRAAPVLVEIGMQHLHAGDQRMHVAIDRLQISHGADHFPSGGHFISCPLAVAVVSSLPSRSRSRPSMKEMLRPFLTIAPWPTRRLGRAGDRKCVFMSMVGTTWPGPTVHSTANDITMSSIAASMPPCTVPSRLQKSGFASNAMVMRPATGSQASGSAPSRVATGLVE